MRINVRKALFYSYDAAHGGRVRYHLKNLDKLSQTYSLDAVKKRQENQFAKLRSDIIDNVPAYSKFDKMTQLHEWPVLDKATLKEKFEAFVSRNFSVDKLVAVKTSGSYGTPFTFYMEEDRKARQQAEIIFFAKPSGYYIGQRHAYVRSAVKSRIRLWLQNQILVAPGVIDNEWLSAMRQVLINSRPELIIGYPTVIGNIASYCLSMGDTPEILGNRGIIATSETLTEQNRAIIEECFGSRVVSRYSSEELGVIAQECPHCGQYHLNEFSHLVEVLRVQGEGRAEPGEAGHVVVTDLHNYALPLVRYDTGDLAEFVPPSLNSCGVKALTNLEGRAIEIIYTTSGCQLTPMAVNGVFRDYKGSRQIVQYQFIQESKKEYRLLLQTIGGNLDVETIIYLLKGKLGDDADIHVEFVTHIPPLKSGKRPYIINRYQDA